MTAGRQFLKGVHRVKESSSVIITGSAGLHVTLHSLVTNVRRRGED